jgi:hypothetical protein
VRLWGRTVKFQHLAISMSSCPQSNGGDGQFEIAKKFFRSFLISAEKMGRHVEMGQAYINGLVVRGLGWIAVLQKKVYLGKPIEPHRALSMLKSDGERSSPELHNLLLFRTP